MYLSQNVSMAMTGSKMQRGVISSVHHVNASAPHDEHVNDATPPFPARPVEGAESMVITKKTQRMFKLS